MPVKDINLSGLRDNKTPVSLVEILNIKEPILDRPLSGIFA